MRTVRVTRYVTPLREGGSLPAIVEADDDGMYVLKFRGAGQGARALIAELVSGELARALGLLVPEIVLVDLDPDLARTEPDPEISALIRASERWQRVTISDFDRTRLAALREQLHQEYLTRRGRPTSGGSSIKQTGGVAAA